MRTMKFTEKLRNMVKNTTWFKSIVKYKIECLFQKSHVFIQNLGTNNQNLSFI